MYRDPSEFRERFKAYKEGKSVREIYGLPRYAEGKSPIEDTADFLKQYEGFRDKTYLDGKGIPTIGYGFTDAKFVNKGRITKAEADAELKRQIAFRLAKLRKKLGPAVWDSLSNDSKKALTSYHYNYPAGFEDDTKFMKYWRSGQYAKAIKEVDAGWNDSANPGLRTRRMKELLLLFSDPTLGGFIVSKTKPEPIIAIPDATKVSTIPTILQQAIDYSDRRNIVAADIDRTIWAHNIMEDMKGAYQVPIWESPSLPALTPVEYDVTPLKTYAGGKAAGEDEPVITQGRAGSRLERFRRSMDPDENDGTAVRVLKGLGRGVADIALDLTKASGIETLNRFATETQRPEDYIDAAFLTVGGAIISKMSKVSPIYMRPFIKSFDDMDAKAIGKYFFQEHPELINKPQEAWYGELAKKSDDYFKQAIERRVRLFDKAGKPLSPESIAAQVSPDLKVASMPGSKYGGVYSPADNTMLINNDRVKDPRTALRVYNHEKAHAMLTAFEDATGLPYPATYGAEMEGLFRYTPEYKAAHKGVHLGLETDASLHEGKSLAAYDKDILGNLLDIDFKNMTDEEFYKYMHNGYFKNLKLSIPEGAKKLKEFVGKLKDGKLPGYKDGTKMQWDADAGVWRQVMDDPYADVFNNLIVTPKYVRPKFEYETNPNYQQSNKNEVVKPDETLWTRQQVEKANNTRTWRSDAADAMHAVGEGAMVASTFAAPEIEGLVYPAYQGVRAAIILAAKSNAPVMQYLRYPIGKAIYGYDAQFPTLYRKIKSLPTEPQDGVIQISNPGNRFMFSDTKQESPIITNFTYDAPVRKHSNGNWDSGFTLAIPGKKLLGKNVISTEPSDLFTYGDNIRVPLKDVTLISGNQKELDLANLYGYKTITSPKLLQLYQQGDSPGVSFVSEGRKLNLRKQELSGYAKEVEKTTRLLFKSPTKNDVDFMNFVLQPKIKGEVYDPNMLDYLIRNGIGEFGDRIGNAELRSYLLDPDRWKYILYDPATHAEYNFRNSMGIDLKKGFRDGKIAIKPSKRGTFTAAAKKHGASVREFESRVLKNPEKYSTAMVKKARFSRNARSWKH